MPTFTVNGVTSQEMADTAIHALSKASVDANARSLPFHMLMKDSFGEGKPSESGGAVLFQGIQFGEHSQVSEMIVGMEPVSLGVVDVLKPAQYNWYMGVMPIVISKREMMTNRGKDQLLNKVDELTRNVYGAFRRRLEQAITVGNQAGFSQLVSLNGVDYTTGLLEENAYASQTNSPGGLSRATYQYSGWLNQREDAGGSISTGGWAALTDLQTKAQNRSETGGPKGIIASEAYYAGLLRLIQANVRYGSEKTIDGRPARIEWGGAPIYSSSYMPNAGTTTTATPISAYAIDTDQIHLIWHENGYYKPDDDGFSIISGTTAYALHLTAMCQLVGKGFGGSGIVVNAESF